MTDWGLGDNILEDGTMLSVTQRMWVKPWLGARMGGQDDRDQAS